MPHYVALKSLPAGVIQDSAGNALAARQVRVYLHGTTTTVTVYPNADGSGTPLTQPLTTDSHGGVPGYVAAEQNLDIVDVLTGAADQAEAISAEDVAAAGGGSTVSSVFGRTGAVTAQTGDYTAAQVGADASGAAAAAQAAAIAASAQGLTPTAVKTAAYSAAAGDFVPVDISGGSLTVTLPNAPADKTRIGVKVIKVDGSHANAATVARAGSDVFNIAGGSTSLTLSALFQGVLLQYSSSAGIWYVSTADTPIGQANGAGSLDATGRQPIAQSPLSVVNASSSATYIPPVGGGGDDAANIASSLPANGGVGGHIKLIPGQVYSFQSVLQMPHDLTGKLIIDPNGAIIRLAAGVYRFLGFDGTGVYQWIEIRPGGIWDWNSSAQPTLVGVSNQGTFGNLVAGAYVGAASFYQIHIAKQKIINGPAPVSGAGSTSASMQCFSFGITATNGYARHVKIEDCDIAGFSICGSITARADGQVIDDCKIRDNRWDSGAVPPASVVTGSLGGWQFGGTHGQHGLIEYAGNYVANAWDVAAEFDQFMEVLCEGNETIDAYNEHFLSRNFVAPLNAGAQLHTYKDNLLRSVNMDPSGTNGIGRHFLLGGSGDPSTPSVLLEKNRSSFETALANVGSRTGLSIQATVSPFAKLTIKDHRISAESLAITAGSGTHEIFTDISSSAVPSTVKIDGHRTKVAGTRTTAGQILESMRINGAEPVLDVRDVDCDYSGLSGWSGSDALLVCSVGYNSGTCRPRGTVRGLKGNGPASNPPTTNLFNTSTNLAGPSSGNVTLRVQEGDASRLTGGGNDYSIPSTVFAQTGFRLIIERITGDRSGSNTTTSPLVVPAAITLPGTTIAAGSNGQTLPQATINVASAAAFPSAGTLLIGTETITYTGKTSTTFTGCTGGTAGLTTGEVVTGLVYQNLDGLEEDVIVSGGTVTDIAFSHDNTTYYSLGQTAGRVRVGPGDFLKLACSVLPTTIVRSRAL